MDELILSFLTPLSTIFLFAIIAITLYTLGKGADILIDEAVAISAHLRIPKAIIGATVVSLGTTLPEVSVSVLAAINGNPDLALGNAVGSIIADTGLIVGIAALISPIVIDYKSIRVQSWIQLLAGVLLVVFALPIFSGSSSGVISQGMGFVLLAFLGIYLYWSFKHSRKEILDEISEEIQEHDKESLVKQFFLMAAGMALVILSSKVLIPAVEISAIRIGVPQSIIAATLVAFGTSLPELTTSVKAVMRGHGDLAIGNIIGADILNVLFVVGMSAAATPLGLAVPKNFYSLHFPAMLLILLTFRVFTLNKGHTLNRKEGALLVLFYLVYLVLNYVG
ncbi:MAG: calcium/sodium antiporter [Clostridiales bacterium]|jgi:cation:H+ antiporter|nr:calcium/sodium antiporter [Clostridiales bacterium]